jgi:hypothetical protein
MKLGMFRAGVMSALAALSASCLDNSDPGPRFTVNATATSPTASPGDAAPVGSIAATVEHMAGDVYMAVEYSGDGLASVVLTRPGATRGNVEISFLPPASLESGTYSATITVRACTDATCSHHIDGSPASVTTHYEIDNNGASTASLDRDRLDISAYTDDVTSIVETLRVTLDPAPATEFYVQAERNWETIQRIEQATYGNASSDLTVTYYPGEYFYAGRYDDSISVTVCYDPYCLHPVDGSPFTVESTLTVDPAGERGLEPLEFASRVQLGHDVVDAEYSKALNYIVMASAHPVNAIYVYDTATGIEKRRNLAKPPTSVSVSPDGLTAAVGHDALISIVDLANVGIPGAPAPRRLDVSVRVFDIVLDGAGFVHAYPADDQFEGPHSIEIATGTETIGFGLLFSNSRARLAPGTTWIYSADNDVSPTDIRKWDIASGTARYLYDSQYHGDYAMCGNVWFNEAGTRIYTPCGNTFRVRANQQQDMIYAGALELSSTGPYYDFLIESLSQSDAADEIALIEVGSTGCPASPFAETCASHLGLYDDDYLNHRATYSIRPMTIGDGYFFQRGLFVFHGRAGNRKFLISRLYGMTDPADGYYLSVID